MEIKVEEINLSLLPDFEDSSIFPRISPCLCNPLPSKAVVREGSSTRQRGCCRAGERRKNWCRDCRLGHLREGGPKNNRKYFFKWFIRFCTVTNLVPFKVLSFRLDTLVPTFSPLLKTFLELFSADDVQDVQRFLFHFADISKTFSFR